MSNRFTRTMPVYARLLRSEPGLLWGVVLGAFAVVATEGLSLGLILPLIQQTDSGAQMGAG
ncbi:MAG: hypothetical protein ACPG4N_10795, partial [Gammaproteobacteria bacterium]